MINIRVVRGVQASLPIATGLVALSGGVAACSVEQADTEDLAQGDSAYTVANPGSGVFELGWAYGTPSGYSFNLTKSSTDEYVRARESMSFAVPAHYLWSRLYPTEPTPFDVARLKQLKAKVKAVFVRGSVVLASTTVSTTAFQGDQTWNLVATTSSFFVHSRATAVRFELEVRDTATSLPPVTLGQNEFLEVPVIGGAVPNKTLLFDNYHEALRHRVLEGGLPVRGSELAFAYTDWRAARLVDASSIDRHIGNQISYSRFGTVEVPIQGELEYEISYGVALDGAWQVEQALTANAKSRLMPPYGRTAWEGALRVPTTTQALHFYFHVKAFLKADYSRYQNVTWKRYADGERLLVRERWDNENNAPGDNWDFATERR